MQYMYIIQAFWISALNGECPVLCPGEKKPPDSHRIECSVGAQGRCWRYLPLSRLEARHVCSLARSFDPITH